MTRGQWGRRIAQAEIALAIAAVIAVGFLFLMAPSFTGGGMHERAFDAADASLVLGAAGLVVGFAWMIRIYRASPEPDPHVWRYRERR